MSENRKYVLSIAGFDPSSGAGITADVKTFEQHNVFGLSVITSNTIQNDSEFTKVYWIQPEIIFEQIEILFKKYFIEFVKIGLIENIDFLERIVVKLKEYNSDIKIIWDPILKATAGKEFHNGFEKNKLQNIFNSVYLITPNLDEFKILFPDVTNPENELPKILKELNINLLLKGGHSETEEIVDTLFFDSNIFKFKGTKFKNYSKHGTGCVLSSAIVSGLANGLTLDKACENAKTYVENFIKSSKTNLGFHH